MKVREKVRVKERDTTVNSIKMLTGQRDKEKRQQDRNRQSNIAGYVGENRKQPASDDTWFEKKSFWPKDMPVCIRR